MLDVPRDSFDQRRLVVDVPPIDAQNCLLPVAQELLRQARCHLPHQTAFSDAHLPLDDDDRRLSGARLELLKQPVVAPFPRLDFAPVVRRAPLAEVNRADRRRDVQRVLRDFLEQVRAPQHGELLVEQRQRIPGRGRELDLDRPGRTPARSQISVSVSVQDTRLDGELEPSSSSPRRIVVTQSENVRSSSGRPMTLVLMVRRILPNHSSYPLAGKRTTINASACAEVVGSAGPLQLRGGCRLDS